MTRIAGIAEAVLRRMPEPPEAADATPPTPQWPEPLTESALYGLAGDFIRLVEPHTEADPSGLLAQLLIGIGNVVGRGPHFRVGSERHSLNLYGCLVGATSVGRKGASWAQVRDMLTRVDPVWASSRLQSGLSSGEGLIWAVRDPTYRTDNSSDRGGSGQPQTVLVDPGVSDKRLLVFEAEFASVLRRLEREGNTLSTVMRESWDGNVPQIMTKNCPTSAAGAHVSMIVQTTRDELRRRLNRSEMANGFANRFLWSCVRKSRHLPRGGTLTDGDLEPLVARLKSAVEFARRLGDYTLTRDAAAEGLWDEVYEWLTDEKPGLCGAITSRAAPQVMRVAAVQAVINKSTVIRPEHLLAALDFWRYTEASAAFIWGEDLGDPLTDRLYAELRSHLDGMTRTEIGEFLCNNVPSKRITEMLMSMAERGKARCVFEKRSTRPTERWFAVDGINGKSPANPPWNPAGEPEMPR